MILALIEYDVVVNTVEVENLELAKQLWPDKDFMDVENDLVDIYDKTRVLMNVKVPVVIGMKKVNENWVYPDYF